MSLEAPSFVPRKEIDTTTRVVVVGIGAITPVGIGAEATWQNVRDGKSGIVEHRFEKYPQIRASVAGMVPEDFKPEVALAGMLPIKDIRRKLHRSTHFALSASFEALQQAGLLVQREGEDAKEREWKINPQIADPADVAAIIGTGIGGGAVIAKVQLSLDERKRASPSDILHALPERVLTPVTMAFDIKGPQYTVVAACATGNVAIASGVKEIMLGDAKIALVCSTEAESVPVGFAMFDVLGALDPEADPKKTPRPFDRSAAGFVMGEGAGALVLIRYDIARKLGVKILAEVTGYGIYGDAYHDTEPSGEGGERALLRAIDKAKEKDAKGKVYNNLHGTGTKIGDPIELGIVRRAYEEKKIDAVGMSSTKGATGHLLGAAGAVEAVICIKALEEQVMPPTLRLEHPIDEAEGLNLVPKEAQRSEFDQAHSNAFGFGGLNAIVVFSRT